MAAPSRIGIELLDYVNDLKLLPRTGWLLAGIPTCESVAEHSFSTMFFALLLTSEINEQPAQQALDRPIDRERVLLLALIHDLAESILTDLPKRSSKLLGRAVKREAETVAIEQLSAYLPGNVELQELWSDYVAGESAEARVVYDADKLEMVHQASRYERGGHRMLDEFWQGHRFHFDASEQLFNALLAWRER